ncbi:MAG: ribosome biogenesis GTP-binding protein YihA/YsxC [Ignavibacteriaceae bacterium]
MFEDVQFVKSVLNLYDLPSDRFPEIILCGRSNVGKSSFINSLLNKKKLARTSITPGKTRSLNYYLIDRKFYIVDLPGFGYARISKKEREKWITLISGFLKKSGYIKLAIHLIDSRINPTTMDVKINNLLRIFNIPYIILLSKADKTSQSGLNSAIKNIEKIFPETDIKNSISTYSSKTGKGRKEIIKLISDLFY